MRSMGRRVEQIELAGETQHGTFVPPTIIELDSIADLEREVFGPVLHVVRYRRRDLDRLIDAINATGYGLTFGLHTRLDETIEHVSARIAAGNLYINRNVIGAVVGVQPFGGRGLSGTGPKAGGPLYLGRLVKQPTVPPGIASVAADPGARDLAVWLNGEGEVARDAAARSLLGAQVELPGPVGERNLYGLHPRGRILLLPQTRSGLIEQLAAALATGNQVVVGNIDLRKELTGLPQRVADRVEWADDWTARGPFSGALIEGGADVRREALAKLAELPGPIVLPQAGTPRLDWLVEEVSTSINTTAAGGNASLMAMA
jgi:RHH-type proline utilization regulon transcriptional repressor/proline dehydrogenase/delta 1-pyrroline-5-carboxylate dehydrogenase